MDQEGSQDSGWWPDMLRQIFLLTSNRPFGWKYKKDINQLFNVRCLEEHTVRSMMLGGFRGYSGGRIIRP